MTLKATLKIQYKMFPRSKKRGSITYCIKSDRMVGERDYNLSYKRCLSLGEGHDARLSFLGSVAESL